MSPLSMCIDKLLFVIMFCPVPEHKKDINSLLFSLRNKKLHALKNFCYLCHKNILADEEQLRCQSCHLSHQSCIRPLFVLLFFVLCPYC